MGPAPDAVNVERSCFWVCLFVIVIIKHLSTVYTMVYKYVRGGLQTGAGFLLPLERVAPVPPRSVGLESTNLLPGASYSFLFAKLYLALTLLILGVLLIWHEPSVLTCSKWRKPSVQGPYLKPPHQTCSPPNLAPALPSTLQPYVLAQDSVEWHRQEMSVSDSQPDPVEPMFLDAGGGPGRVVK